MQKPTSRQAFVLRIKPSRHDRVPDALADGELIIGWSYALGLLHASADLARFRQIIQNTYHAGEPDELKAGKAAGSMWRFIREMREGDIVLVPHHKHFYVARVTGPAYHDASKVAEDTAHRRPVEWLNQSVPLPQSAASSALQVRFGRPRAVTPASDLLADVLTLPIDWLPSAPSRALDLDLTSAPRVKCDVSRIVRDTDLTHRLKSLHGGRCQICGHAITFPDGRTYSEAHHIQPLGAPHGGPDIEQNVIVLCPNHHAMCDYGAIELDLRSLRKHPSHSIDPLFITYHNDRIFKRVI
jgi:5-methylcytosine-specific restriction endonuclease McrA